MHITMQITHEYFFFIKVTESGAGVRIFCFAEYQNSASISLDSIRLNSLCYGTLCLKLHLSVRFTGYEFIDMAWNTIPMRIQSICMDRVAPRCKDAGTGCPITWNRGGSRIKKGGC